jgi:hypothetical protein
VSIAARNAASFRRPAAQRISFSNSGSTYTHFASPRTVARTATAPSYRWLRPLRARTSEVPSQRTLRCGPRRSRTAVGGRSGGGGRWRSTPYARVRWATDISNGPRLSVNSGTRRRRYLTPSTPGVVRPLDRPRTPGHRSSLRRSTGRGGRSRTPVRPLPAGRRAPAARCRRGTVPPRRGTRDPLSEVLVVLGVVVEARRPEHTVVDAPGRVAVVGSCGAEDRGSRSGDARHCEGGYGRRRKGSRPQ